MQRQDIHKGCVLVPTNELRAQVAQAVEARRMRKANTRTNQEFLKMSRKQLENFLEQERRCKLGASITRFAVSAEECDKRKGKPQARKVTENQARINRKRSKKKTQNLKKAAEEETAEIQIRI